LENVKRNGEEKREKEEEEEEKEEEEEVVVIFPSPFCIQKRPILSDST
jgi:hypothetical protein